MTASTFPQGPHATASDRAKWLKSAGGLNAAVDARRLEEPVTLPLAEALVLGLMRQGVTKYLAIFGHGSTAVADVLNAYEAAGLVRCWQFRNEVEMAHAGTALSWVYGEVAAVVTSIGPGALQAMAASLAAASNGVGVYHLYGDETTHGEGYNMQQVPKPAQGLFSQITSLMGSSYTLHSPGALRDGLRKGAGSVFHPWRPGPFFMNLPLNTQPAPVTLRLDALPVRPHFAPLAPASDDIIEDAARQIAAAGKVAIKLGGGSRGASDAIKALAEAAGALVVTSPGAGGVLPADHSQNMQVGGSKGSISGNWAMEEAELLVVIGSRAVCQADCSGIGWPKVKAVININADPVDVQHYNRTTALPGDAAVVASRLASALKAHGPSPAKREWLAAGAAKRADWSTFLDRQATAAPVYDGAWSKPVLTQPRVIRIAAEFCRRHGAVKFFDAGDVQANGFQIVEDRSPNDTYTETGASYMGFAVSALLSSALAENGRYSVAFTGDGSFMMNPQVLIDGVEHGVHGTILLLDNRRMAAISHLQLAQYGRDFRTNDSVAVDYVQMASAVKGVKALHGGTDEQYLAAALEEARRWRGLSLVHVPVYFGDHPAVGLGAYGQWNVGNWVEAVQRQYTETLI
ncbi:thiamine pyrophosphate-binding protein [Rhizobium mayense]|uniref:Thiamine pyrophosphate-dependent enzyme n=1 Tax=Rhizobium mayense TaxID=1312184 RepID=A0ABT7K6U0_9HYPH|nr:thiamine pyrophosphate-dependent enzyme [Rhizobium mayense]MDL2403730.1 thiamine pyrophosphate-dependent enzyme [Rhizobium mayense]